jgi:hypothetical protein
VGGVSFAIARVAIRHAGAVAFFEGAIDAMSAGVLSHSCRVIMVLSAAVAVAPFGTADEAGVPAADAAVLDGRDGRDLSLRLFRPEPRLRVERHAVERTPTSESASRGMPGSGTTTSTSWIAMGSPCA